MKNWSFFLTMDNGRWLENEARLHRQTNAIEGQLKINFWLCKTFKISYILLSLP